MSVLGEELLLGEPTWLLSSLIEVITESFVVDILSWRHLR